MKKVLLSACFFLFVIIVGKSQTTGDYRSNAATMNWSTTASWQTWNGSAWITASSYPGENTGTNAVTIQDGHTVTIDVSPANAIASLTVGGGTSGALTFEATTARTLTVTGNTIISANGTFSSNSSGTQTGHVFSLDGNLTNNGTLDFSTNANAASANLTFTGSADQLVSGTGATTDLYLITMSKSSINNIVEFNVSNFSIGGESSNASNSFLATNTGTGTLKFSGSNSFSGAAFPQGYTLPSTFGFWLNNPNFSVWGAGLGGAIVRGLLRISNGVYTVGSSQTNLTFNAGTFIMEGGSLSVSNAFITSGSSVNSFTISGGTITVSLGTNNISFQSFSVNPQSSFTMSGGTIVLAKKNTATNDYSMGATTYNITGGTLQIGSGATASNSNFTVSAGTSGATKLPNISVYSSAVQTITLTSGSGRSYIFCGKIDIPAGTTFNFQNMPVTLKSTATNTAFIGTIDGTLSNATNVTIERYIGGNTPRKAWRLLGVPLTSTTGSTIRAGWQEGATSAASNPNAGYGTHITAADGSTTGGFDASSISSGTSSIYYFSGTGLNTPADLTTAKVSENGGAYYLYIRGDRSLSLSTVNTTATNTTLRMSGTVNQGNVTAGVAGTGAMNFSLIPNPYPSNIDFELVRASNGNSSTFYVWDANLGTIGGYRTITRDGSGNYSQTPSTGGGAQSDATARYIQSGQAFWVPGQTQYNFTESMKVSNNPTNNGFRETSNTQQVTIDLAIKQSNNDYLQADGVRTLFDNSYSAAVTDEDAVKFSNFTENLAISRGSQSLSIDARPAISNNDTIFLKLWNTGIKDYRFTIAASNLNTSYNAYFIDASTNTSTPLSLTSTTDYDFSITTATASQAQNRFMIVFLPSTALPLNITNIKAFEKGNAIQVDWNVATETGVRNYEVEKSANGRDFVPASLVNAKENNNSSVNYSWLDINPVNSNNYYRIKMNTISGETKCSAIVNVKLGKTEPGIAIYPNPVKGDKMGLQFINLGKGNYTLKVFNATGQLIIIKFLQHNSGSAVEEISLPTGLNKGVYQLEVAGNNNRFSQRIVVQ